LYGDVNADTYEDPNTPRTVCGHMEAERSNTYEAQAINKMPSVTAYRPNAIADCNGTATWDGTDYHAMPLESTLEHAVVLYRRCGDVNAVTYDDPNTPRTACGLMEAERNNSHEAQAIRKMPSFTAGRPNAIADNNGTATWDYTGYQDRNCRDGIKDLEAVNSRHYGSSPANERTLMAQGAHPRMSRRKPVRIKYLMCSLAKDLEAVNSKPCELSGNELRLCQMCAKHAPMFACVELAMMRPYRAEQSDDERVSLPK
jgi:hypothetical protein